MTFEDAVDQLNQVGIWWWINDPNDPQDRAWYGLVPQPWVVEHEGSGTYRVDIEGETLFGVDLVTAATVVLGSNFS